jgi:hypothetical protein
MPAARYGLSKEHVDAVVLPAPVKNSHASATLERQAQAGGHRAKGKAAARATVKVSLMTAPLDGLSGSQRRALLCALHARLHKLLALRGGAAGPAADAAVEKQARCAVRSVCDRLH